MVDHGKLAAVARRLPRRTSAALAAGLAVSCVALTAAPAAADQIRTEEWWLAALHVTTAQESSKGSGVTVAILDTGVDAAQPDLTGSVTTGPDYTASGRKAGGPFWGISGTAVASLIAGHGHGAQGGDGIIGVAPSAKILSVRVTLESNDPQRADASITARLPGAIANGIGYAVSHGAQVIDLPLDPATLAGTSPGGSSAERAAVAYALSKNVVLVAPAGDGGAGTDPVNYPAAYPGVISVGAFNQSFTKAKFTSRRSYVTLTAAGDGVAAASPSGYAVIHSTSAASAVVAGMAALIRAQFPTLTPAQVTSALTQSTVFRPPGGRKDGSGYGTADAQAALLEAAHINAAVPAHSGAGGAVAAPSSPPVHVRSLGILNTLRYAAFGLAAVLLLGVLIFALTSPVRRRRRTRAARLAPLHNAARAAVRAQPDLSAVPPAAGVQFAGAQLARTQFPDAQFPDAQFPGAQYPGAQYPGAQYPGAQYPGAQYPGAQYPGARFADAPFPGDQYVETPFPGDPHPEDPFPGDQYAAPAPFPGDPRPAAPFPGDPHPEDPFPGDQYAEAPFPGDQYATLAPFPGDPRPAAPFPGDPHPEALFPGDQYATLAPFPGDPHPEDPFPGDQYAEAPFPGDPAAETQFAGGPVAEPPLLRGQVAGPPFPGAPFPEAQFPEPEVPGTTGPFPAIPSGNGSPGRTAGAPPRALPPTPRPHVVRQPQISGTPPWKPAEKPDGELPWAAPNPGSVGRPASARRVIPAGVQPWGPATHSGSASGGENTGGRGPDGPGSESMFPDKVEMGGRTPGSMPLPAPQSGRDESGYGESAGNGSADEEASKLYVWNPAEVTEAFPKVPPGEPGRK